MAGVAALVVACGSRVRPTTSAGAAEEPAEEWIAKAVVQSRIELQDRCAKLAPASVRSDEDPAYARCTTRVAAALEEQWKKGVDEALATCVARGGEGGCCILGVTGSDAGRRLSECERRCAGALGRPLDALAHCAQGYDSFVAGIAPSPALASALAGCTVDVTDVESICAPLSTRNEFALCELECRARIERAQLELEAEACARRALDFLTVRCDAPPSGWRTGARTSCEEWCKAKLAELRARR